MDYATTFVFLLSVLTIVGVFITTRREVARGRFRSATFRFLASLLSYVVLALVISGLWFPPNGIVLALVIGGLFILVVGSEYLIVRGEKAKPH
ncbi:MAG: hypothetical protein HY340_02440 [Candidatus Kerfeldbacteria bacterium]|nr:hypothetical protein [Candidatus Kerfeldbacteria bacterium]